MDDVSPGITKRHRIYNAFVACQKARQDRTYVLAFIRHSMKPERYLRAPKRFEPLRLILNRALLFAGLTVEADGTLAEAAPATTHAEAQRRARTPVDTIGVHDACPGSLRPRTTARHAKIRPQNYG
jgi:hypothetical protein